MTPQGNNPLVTFALFTYNQEKYIKDAVESALRQTYSPLEIIISDDKSSDNTIEIIEQTISKYNGPHIVKTQSNDKNLGIGSHVNKLLNQASGELIILAAGDDISQPERTEEIVKHWISNNKVHDSLWSSIQLIDSQGNILGEKKSPPDNSKVEIQTRELVPRPLGCSHALTKRLHAYFGDFSSKIVYEDRVIAFRAIILGGHGYVDKPLVKYRIHEESISRNSDTQRTLRSAEERLNLQKQHLTRCYDVLNQYLTDLETLKKLNGAPIESKEIEKSIIEHKLKIDSEIRIYSPDIKARMMGLLALAFSKDRSARKLFKYLLNLPSPKAQYILEEFSSRLKSKVKKIAGL